MTQQEFKERCHVAVSAEEFRSIHAVYVASEVDKDTFCHYWRCMNRRRVEAAIEAEEAAEAAERERSRAFDLQYWLKSVCNSGKTARDAARTHSSLRWLEAHGYNLDDDATHVAWQIMQNYGF